MFAYNTVAIELKTPSLILVPPEVQFKDELAVIAWLTHRGVQSPPARELVLAYRAVCTRFGVNWLWTLCQACLETAFWRFGGDVKAEQHNYCGLGAVGGGVPGESFDTILQGVTAHVHHLALYAGLPIPKEFLLADRTKAVYEVILNRAASGKFEDLSGKWASDTGYGDKIRKLVLECESFRSNGATTDPVTPAKPLQGLSVGIDAGHSRVDTGARGRGPNPPTEYAMNVLQAQTVIPLLTAAGALVEYKDPVPDDLRGIGRWAGAKDLFLAFHHNAANADGTDEGTEVFIPTGASYKAAQVADAILKEICRELGTINRGVKRKDWTVISQAFDSGCPCPILIESYFIDDYSDVAVTTDRSIRAAKATYRAILSKVNLL